VSLKRTHLPDLGAETWVKAASRQAGWDPAGKESQVWRFPKNRGQLGQMPSVMAKAERGKLKGADELSMVSRLADTESDFSVRGLTGPRAGG